MASIPQWYRWLLVAGATLIMSACTTPLSLEGNPETGLLLPPIVLGPSATVNSPKPTTGDQHGATRPHTNRAAVRGTSAAAAASSPDNMAASQNAPPRSTDSSRVELAETDVETSSHAVHGRRSSSRITLADITSTLSVPTEIRADAKQATPDPSTASKATPPPRTKDKKSLGADDRAVQQLAPVVDRSARAAINPRTRGERTASSAKSAVYLRLNGEAPTVSTASSQVAEEPVDEVGSPFADDPAPLTDQTHVDGGTIEPGMVHDGTLIPDQMAPIIPGPMPMGVIEGELPAEVFPHLPRQSTIYPQVTDCVPGPALAEDCPAPGALWMVYPDEYICDGGDRNSEVQVLNDWSLRNLDPEDTVGHYDTLDHRVVVQPSNRVCIYAPRFAATRQVTAAYENEKHLQPLAAGAPLAAATDLLQEGSGHLHQNLAPEHHLSLQPALIFRDRLPGTEASQAVALIVAHGEFSAHEEFRVIRYGVHKQAEKPRLAEYVENAISWSHDTAVQVVLDEVVAQTRVTVEGVEEFFNLGKGAPKLRVIKTASVADALPGEEVEFTLRYDNVGYQAIGNVTLIDNLTTRLEYIKGTAECSADAEFFTDDNQADSLTLRWEITDPVKAGEGGIIRFKCRVR